MLKIINASCTPSPSHIRSSPWTHSLRRYTRLAVPANLQPAVPAPTHDGPSNRDAPGVAAVHRQPPRRPFHRPAHPRTDGSPLYHHAIPPPPAPITPATATHRPQRRGMVVVTATSAPAPGSAKPKRAAPRKPRRFVPPKAAVNLTPKAREFCRDLLENAPNPEIAGILLRFQQSRSGEPRMVFSFEFVKGADLGRDDEGVSLEVQSDGTTPVPPLESMSDGRRKLYLHQSAILKVLGGTLDVKLEDDVFTPVLYDREGNEMDPNA